MINFTVTMEKKQNSRIGKNEHGVWDNLTFEDWVAEAHDPDGNLLARAWEGICPKPWDGLARLLESNMKWPMSRGLKMPKESRKINVVDVDEMQEVVADLAMNWTPTDFLRDEQGRVLIFVSPTETYHAYVIYGPYTVERVNIVSIRTALIESYYLEKYT